MNKQGFLGIINLIIIILVIVGVVVSYNFFKSNFVEDDESETSEDVGDLTEDFEDSGNEIFEDEDLDEDLEIE